MLEKCHSIAQDGSITVLDVENGEVLTRQQLAAGAVACLSWVEEAATPDSPLDNDSLLPPNGAARFCGAPEGPLPPAGRGPPQVLGTLALETLETLEPWYILLRCCMRRTNGRALPL